MAYLEQEESGSYRFGWQDPVTNKLKRARLGRMAKKEADKAVGYIQDLVDAIKTRSEPPPDARSWVAGLTPKAHTKLAEAGLFTVRKSRTLESVCLDMIARAEGDKAEGTLFHYDIAMREAVKYFGKDRDISTITTGEALDFHRTLRRPRKVKKKQTGAIVEVPGLGVSTAAKRCATLSAIFQDAKRHKLIQENPFADKAVPKTTPPAPDDRRYFVPREDALKVMDELPDTEMRAMFALARWAGVRHDEPYKMTWANVFFGTDTKTGILRIPCPKTERKTGRPYRECPMFPEVEKALLDLRDAAPEGEQYLLPTYRTKTKQCATNKLKDAIPRAGVTEWERPWQNLRSSAEIEMIAAGNPEFAVAEWVGHDVKVAREHYLRATDTMKKDAVKRATTLAEREGKTSEENPGENPGVNPPEISKNKDL